MRATRCFFNLKRNVIAKHHVLCRKVQLWTRKATMGTRICSQLPILAILIGKHRRTTLTHLSIAYHVLLLMEVFPYPKSNRLIGNTQRNHCAQRIVGVVKQYRIGRFTERLYNCILYAINFATTIKLVAEKIQQQDIACLDLRQRVRQPQLIRFKYTPLNTSLCLKKRGSNPIRKICPSAVASNCFTLPFKSIGNHIGYGCFTVGSHNNNGTFRNLTHGFRDNLRIKFERNFPRHIRSWSSCNMTQTPGTCRTCRTRQ